ILRTLATVDYDQGAFTMSAERTHDHFRSLFSRFSINLYGEQMDPSLDSNVLSVWRFFYLCGVLNARVSDTTKNQGYRHLNPADDPMLVSKPRWNDVQGALWEVNTVYRDFLISLQEDADRRTGIAAKQPHRAAHKPRRRGRRR